MTSCLRGTDHAGVRPIGRPGRDRPTAGEEPELSRTEAHDGVRVDDGRRAGAGAWRTVSKKTSGLPSEEFEQDSIAEPALAGLDSLGGVRTHDLYKASVNSRIPHHSGKL